MKRIFVIIILFAQALSIDVFAQKKSDTLRVTQIYADSNYNAFTSLIKFRKKFYCSFRSAERHVYGRDGVVKIISSRDGENWNEVSTISAPGYDLRDAQLSLTPDGRIQVNMGGSVYNGKKLLAGIPHVSFSNKRGSKFSNPTPVNMDVKIKTNYNWLWSVTWYNGVGYGSVYTMNDRQKEIADTIPLHVVKTLNGIDYYTVTTLLMGGYPSEAVIRGIAEGEMLILIRRDREDKKAYLGSSNPPYTNWTFVEMPFSLGGPEFIALDENHFIGGGRINGEYTGLFSFTREGEVKIILKLPSDRDSSYPGFVIENEKLYVSYYSSHETEKASIYFAEIPLSYFK